MASRALTSAASRRTPAGGGNSGDWRAILRRSFRRSAELIGGLVLFALALFLALALASYTQTDPSGSTASGSPVENWMGLAGAWAAERVFVTFGLPGALLLPLLVVYARRLWDAAGDLIAPLEDDDDLPALPAWWTLALLLVAAIVLLATTLALALPRLGATLPAGPGGLAGLLGAAGCAGWRGLPRRWLPRRRAGSRWRSPRCCWGLASIWPGGCSRSTGCGC